jgi:2'-5' RNA ligase
VRIFVAADVSDETRAAMHAVRLAIEGVVATVPVPPRVTWVKPSAAHVTVRFIGEVDEDVARAIGSALAAPLPLPPFDVQWATVGVFPHGRAGLRAPRAIWIGASDGAASFSALADAVNQRLEPIVGRGDDRPYSPHLTIGRVKFPGRHAPWAEALAAAGLQPTRSRIDHVTLYRSQLSSRGPTYTSICEVTLCR